MAVQTTIRPKPLVLAMNCPLAIPLPSLHSVNCVMTTCWGLPRIEKSKAWGKAPPHALQPAYASIIILEPRAYPAAER